MNAYEMKFRRKGRKTTNTVHRNVHVINEFSRIAGLIDIVRDMEKGRIGERVERFTQEGRTGEDARGMADVLLAG